MLCSTNAGPVLRLHLLKMPASELGEEPTMQCPVCHAEVGPQNTFCTNCGSPVQGASAAPQQNPYEPVSTPSAYPPPSAASSGYAPPQGSYPPPQSGYPPQGAAAGSGGLSETAAAAISYLTIIPAIIFLVVDPYKKMPLVRFHSFQSIGLCVAYIVVWIALMILQLVLHFIPLIGVLFFFVGLGIGIAFFIAWLMCILKASKGEWFKLPVIGDFAESQARAQ